VSPAEDQRLLTGHFFANNGRNDCALGGAYNRTAQVANG